MDVTGFRQFVRTANLEGRETTCTEQRIRQTAEKTKKIKKTRETEGKEGKVECRNSPKGNNP
jgi:hypothetical protein